MLDFNNKMLSYCLLTTRYQWW